MAVLDSLEFGVEAQDVRQDVETGTVGIACHHRDDGWHFVADEEGPGVAKGAHRKVDTKGGCA